MLSEIALATGQICGHGTGELQPPWEQPRQAALRSWCFSTIPNRSRQTTSFSERQQQWFRHDRQIDHSRLPSGSDLGNDRTGRGVLRTGWPQCHVSFVRPSKQEKAVPESPGLSIGKERSLFSSRVDLLRGTEPTTVLETRTGDNLSGFITTSRIGGPSAAD